MDLTQIFQSTFSDARSIQQNSSVLLLLYGLAGQFGAETVIKSVGQSFDMGVFLCRVFAEEVSVGIGRKHLEVTVSLELGLQRWRS